MSPATTSYEVRAEFETLLERDLLGPWDGPEEELPPGTPPAERYLLGRLVPRTRPSEAPPVEVEVEDEPDLVDREVIDAGDDSAADLETTAGIRSGSMSASALGLSFRVPAEIDTLVVEATWGRYATTKSEVHITEQGRPRSVWKRTPAGGQVEIVLAEGDSIPIVVDGDYEGVVLRATVRTRGACKVVDLALVNDQTVPDTSVDSARLYQTSLTVTALDGAAAIFVGHNDPNLGSLRRRAMTSDAILRCCTGRGGSTPTVGNAPSTPTFKTARCGRGASERPASRPQMSR